MKSLLVIALLLPFTAGAHSSFKVKSKVSYCNKAASLEDAFVEAKFTADQRAAELCGQRGMIASRVTEYKTKVDKSDCLAKVKARYVCAVEPIEPIGKVEEPKQGPAQGSDQTPASAPQQEPKTEPIPVPQQPK